MGFNHIMPLLVGFGLALCCSPPAEACSCGYAAEHEVFVGELVPQNGGFAIIDVVLRAWLPGSTLEWTAETTVTLECDDTSGEDAGDMSNLGGSSTTGGRASPVNLLSLLFAWFRRE